ncbi:MAG: peptidoglycan DD-metalloendopeptidase family protein [Saprospiraceae bacterium]|nr:peptidoglycan DD-metalloendopeptidase family protein [Saprospiraceae bacterium]
MKSLNDIPAWTKCFLLLVLFVLGSLTAQAQNLSRTELETRRKNLISEIGKTSEELSATRRNREATLNRFLILKKSIRQRQDLISTLQLEVAFNQQSIQRTEQVLTALQNDLDRLRVEYSHLLRVALKHKLSQSYIQFLYSTRSINDAFQRWQYIRQYERYRQRQAKLIIETQETLTSKAQQLAIDKLEKDSLLRVVVTQQADMNQELTTKNKLLVSLQTDEKRLANDLAQQEKAHAELNAMIESVIRTEMLASRKKERTREALTTKKEKEAPKPSVPKSKEIGFAQLRGKLPWPVDGGQIIKPFGRYKHPKFKSVNLTNNGIDIKTKERSDVRSIYDGRVAGTQFIPGYQNTVIIQHGLYYTVYSNLAEIFVKRGDDVAQNQKIGRLNASKPEIHFEIWQEKKRLNPETWVNPS